MRVLRETGAYEVKKERNKRKKKKVQKGKE
jgi:hypothetical protein